MAHVLKQLGQSRPANTTAVSIYSPGASTETVIHNIVVSNTSASSAAYRICVDDNGTTYDETTAMFWDVSLGANSTDILELKICMNNSTGNLSVRTDTASALTFTVNGEEFS